MSDRSVIHSPHPTESSGGRSRAYAQSRSCSHTERRSQNHPPVRFFGWTGTPLQGIRVENALQDESHNEMALKEDSKVEVTIEADPEQ
jgi:hypothetical protein